MTARPLISVVIPTRDRAGTLRAALRTCAEQGYDRLEIVVSDNHSADHTRAVVDEAADERVRYVNPGRRLGMSENWEFALAHTTGDYVAFLGDDDGLLPGAIEDLAAMAVDLGTDAISWRAAFYQWPDALAARARNTLIVPLATGVKLLDAAAELEAVTTFRRGYQRLPWLYRGVVSRRAIERVMAEAGRFFHSRGPDVYSGVAVACVIDAYHHSERPYSVNGASAHSFGASQFAPGDGRPAAEVFDEESTIPFHPRLGRTAASIPLIVTECLLQARDHMPSAQRFPVRLDLAFTAALDEVRRLPEPQFSDACAAILESAERNGMGAAVEGQLAGLAHRPARSPRPLFGYNPRQGTMVVDCTAHEVQDVHGAAQLAACVLAVRDQGLARTLGLRWDNVRELLARSWHRMRAAVTGR